MQLFSRLQPLTILSSQQTIVPLIQVTTVCNFEVRLVESFGLPCGVEFSNITKINILTEYIYFVCSDINNYFEGRLEHQNALLSSLFYDKY